MVDERFRYEKIGEEKYLIDNEMGETLEIGNECILENINGMHELIVRLIGKCEENDVDIYDLVSVSEYDYLLENRDNDGLGYYLD